MTGYDLTDTHTLTQWVWEYAISERLDCPRRPQDKTIRFISAISVRTLFNVLKEQQRLSSRTADRLYLTVRKGVYHSLCRWFEIKFPSENHVL